MSRSGRTNHSVPSHLYPSVQHRVGGGAEPYTPSVHLSEVFLRLGQTKSSRKQNRQGYGFGLGASFKRTAVEPWTPGISEEDGKLRIQLVPSGQVPTHRPSPPTQRSRKAQPTQELDLPDISACLSQLENQILLMQERLMAKLDTLSERSQATLLGQPTPTNKPLSSKGQPITRQLSSRLVALSNRLTNLESDLMARLDAIQDTSQIP